MRRLPPPPLPLEVMASLRHVAETGCHQHGDAAMPAHILAACRSGSSPSTRLPSSASKGASSRIGAFVAGPAVRHRRALQRLARVG